MKNKITNKQFFLIINGPSCSGKSFVSDVICTNYGGIFKASGDKIKWLISDYEATIHRGIVHNMVTELIKVALSNNLSVLKEGALWKVEDYVELAKQKDIPLFIANIEAPLEVLFSRFKERIEAKKQGAKISNTDPKRFKELYDMYINTKIDTPLIFDSSKQSPEEIVELIVDYIGEH